MFFARCASHLQKTCDRVEFDIDKFVIVKFVLIKFIGLLMHAYFHPVWTFRPISDALLNQNAKYMRSWRALRYIEELNFRKIMLNTA